MLALGQREGQKLLDEFRMTMESKKIAVLVDAGYFCAQASETLFGHTKRRDEIEIDEKKMLLTMQELGKLAFEGREVLRVYWYDAPPQRGQMSQSQEAIGMLEGAKLRLGKLNGGGQQKLVDALLCRDIEDLARNRAVDSILLCSGDEDLLMAVEFAQARGVQVKLLGIGPGHASIGQDIAMASDGVRKMGKETAAEIMVLKAGAAPVAAKKGSRSKKSDAKPAKAVQAQTPLPQAAAREARPAQSLHASPEISQHSRLAADAQKAEAPHQQELRQNIPRHENNPTRSNGQASQAGQAPPHNGSGGKKRRNRKNRRDRDRRPGQENFAPFQASQHEQQPQQQQQQAARPKDKDKQEGQAPEALQHAFQIPRAALVQPQQTQKALPPMMLADQEKAISAKVAQTAKSTGDKKPAAAEAAKQARKPKAPEGSAEAAEKKPAAAKKAQAAKKPDEAKKPVQKRPAKPKSAPKESSGG